MKKTAKFLCLASVVLLYTSQASAEIIDGCISVETVNEAHCIDNDSLTVRAKNICSDTDYRVRICIERRTKNDSCGSDLLEPGDSFKYYTCEPAIPPSYKVKAKRED